MMTLLLSSKTVFGMFINFGVGEYRLEATQAFSSVEQSKTKTGISYLKHVVNQTNKLR